MEEQMKLNFVKLLTQNEGTPEQVAQEIVLLENKVIEVKAQRLKLQEDGRNMRSRQLCGEAVSASEMRDNKENLSQIEEDMIVFGENIDKLTAKLLVMLEEQNKREWELWRKGRGDLLAEDREHATEIVKLYARIAVLRGLLGDFIGRGNISEEESNRISAVERKEFMDSLPKPTCLDKSNQLVIKEHTLKNFKVQEAMTALLEQYRQPTVIEQEKEALV